MLLEHIQLTNLLSFGPRAEELELGPLNVLIGPNGCGKSNFIDAIGLLRGTPTDLAGPTYCGRGVADWIWQGEPRADSARLQAVVRPAGQPALRYSVEVAARQQGFTVIDGYRPIEHTAEDGKSVLAQAKDAQHHPELAGTAKELAHISLYREWTFGPNNVVRSLQKTDLPNANLAEDQANLGLVLNRLSRDCTARERIVEALRRLYEDISDFHVNIECNAVQVFVQERSGRVTVPVTRLSDGTTRYLSLLAILCDPQPPPLVCLEAPELGLHPDILPGLAKLLLEASERCQLIVTTHSEVLVDALTDQPESIVVCEKEDGQTKLKRLSRSELRHWLGKYRLGELWSSGKIGGNRW